MREIKFRGKGLGNTKWEYGGYYKHAMRQVSPFNDSLKDIDIAHLIIQSGFADGEMPMPLSAVEVDPETVGQCTGLHDKNGQEIYEGDIARQNKRLFIATWNNNTAAFTWETTDKSCSFPCFNVGTVKSMEVIGNIYENPDLLEVQDDKRAINRSPR